MFYNCCPFSEPFLNDLIEPEHKSRVSSLYSVDSSFCHGLTTSRFDLILPSSVQTKGVL
jgi:hypothetical protein